jgi:hypothetical protein
VQGFFVPLPRGGGEDIFRPASIAQLLWIVYHMFITVVNESTFIMVDAAARDESAAGRQ